MVSNFVFHYVYVRSILAKKNPKVMIYKPSRANNGPKKAFLAKSPTFKCPLVHNNKFFLVESAFVCHYVYMRSILAKKNPEVAINKPFRDNYGKKKRLFGPNRPLLRVHLTILTSFSSGICLCMSLCIHEEYTGQKEP